MMKKLTHSIAAKAAAVILFAVLIAALSGSLLGIVFMGENGYYDTDEYSFYDSDICADITRSYANNVFYNYLPLVEQSELSEEDTFQLKKYKQAFSEENTNLFFTIRDETDTILLTNYNGQNYATIKTYHFDRDSYEYDGSTASYSPMTDAEYDNQADKTYTVTCYVKDPITAQDNYYSSYKTSQTLYSSRYLLIAAAVMLALLALADFIFLMNAAGRKKDRDGIVLSGLNKLPFDLYLAGAVLIALPILYITFSFYHGTSFIWNAVGLTATITALCLLVLAVCLSFAARVKAGRWWQNTVIYRVLRFFYRALSSLFKAVGNIFPNLPMLWKMILLFIGYLFINFIFILLLFGRAWGIGVLFGLLFNLAVLTGLCTLMLQLNKIKRGSQLIAAGDFESKLDTAHLRWDIKTHAETLNNIQNGMALAVEDRLKSERLKTELITNVSHDIKTPLTSIVNYVDLLKKENIEDETIQGYIEILDRQSSRLKKLTEDLVEASKASTGNVALSLARTNVIELLNQSIGEYAERFAECELESVISIPPGDLYITADGRFLWRVFDNLLGNVCKYSQPGTRVYISVAQAEAKAVITLKNISRYSLNVTSDELIERFVRGDSARTTEGSGLGLSIAKSLTELQHGVFELSVDGDLFKVTIRFDT